MKDALKRRWNGDSFTFDTRQESLIPEAPKLGMVIGTFASVPYVHLQLEARKRFYSHIPCLVHDDGSHKSSELAALCEQYGADFEHNTQRHGFSLGDLSAFVGGLLWAQAKGVDLLLKVSRRWLFLMDWSKSLIPLAIDSDYATYSSYTKSYGYGFRTECLALAVSKWGSSEFMTPAVGRIRAGGSVFMEAHIHKFACDFERNNSQKAEQWRTSHPMMADKAGYALWGLVETDRRAKSPNYLWHDSAPPEAYFRLSHGWELPYTRADFKDPNEGAGDGRNMPPNA